MYSKKVSAIRYKASFYETLYVVTDFN